MSWQDDSGFSEEARAIMRGDNAKKQELDSLIAYEKESQQGPAVRNVKLYELEKELERAMDELRPQQQAEDEELKKLAEAINSPETQAKYWVRREELEGKKKQREEAVEEPFRAKAEAVKKEWEEKREDHVAKIQSMREAQYREGRRWG